MVQRLLVSLLASILLAAACSPTTVTPPVETPAAAATIPAAAPTPTLPPIANLDDDQFEFTLIRALEDHDFTTLRSLMLDRFSISTFITDLQVYSSDEGIQVLRDGVLAQGSSPFPQPNTDVTALLSGTDPLSLWGPSTQPVQALHVTGLGPDAKGEGVLVLGRDVQGGWLYWHGIILPQDGSFQPVAQLPGGVVPTDVKQVKTKVVLNLRSGPGLDYAVEGMLQVGDIANVEGKSEDGKWWWVVCEPDASGHCFISADTNFSEPVTSP